MGINLQSILYAQLLRRCGYRVVAITSMRETRGCGTEVQGTFELDGQAVKRVTIQERDGKLTVGARAYKLVVQPNGDFDLFSAHSDGPR